MEATYIPTILKTAKIIPIFKTGERNKGGVHSFFNKLTRLKIIPDRDVPMALLF